MTEKTLSTLAIPLLYMSVVTPPIPLLYSLSSSSLLAGARTTKVRLLAHSITRRHDNSGQPKHLSTLSGGITPSSPDKVSQHPQARLAWLARVLIRLARWRRGDLRACGGNAENLQCQ